MKRHPSLAKAGHDKSLKCCDILIKYVEFCNLKLACLNCVYLWEVATSWTATNTTIITLLHSATFNNLNVFYISDTTMCAECLTSSWRLTEMLHTLQCQFTAQCSPTYITLCYVNGTTTHLTCWPFLWPTCDWMLQTLQYQFAAQHSHDYITLFP